MRVTVEAGKQHIGPVIKEGLRAVAVVVVNVQHRHALQGAVAQVLRGQRGIVQKSVAAEEIRPGVVAGRAGQRNAARAPSATCCAAVKAKPFKLAVVQGVLEGVKGDHRLPKFEKPNEMCLQPSFTLHS